MHCGEMLTTSTFDASKHLAVSDIAVDSHSNPQCIKVNLKTSKIDQFGEDMNI